MSDWCILTCRAEVTLALAASLAEAGIEAWAPVRIEERRSRAGDKPEPIRHPLLACFVFARAIHQAELLAITHMPTRYLVWDAVKRRMVAKGHPYFRMMRDGLDYARTPDRELDALRANERRIRPPPPAKAWQPGDRVKLTEGAYAGLRGVVEAVKGKRAAVAFPKCPQVPWVESWLLLPDVDEPPAVKVEAAATEQAPQAKAA